MAGRLAQRLGNRNGEIVMLSKEESAAIMRADFKDGEEEFYDKEIDNKVFRRYGEFLRPNRFRIRLQVEQSQAPEVRRKKQGKHLWRI